MITEVHIQNYRSIVDQRVKLHPFTLIVGQNGAGKSNFLRCLSELAKGAIHMQHGDKEAYYQLEKHYNHTSLPQRFSLLSERNPITVFEEGNSVKPLSAFSPPGIIASRWSSFSDKPSIFQINPKLIGQPEPVVKQPQIHADGAGSVQILEGLKTGDREDLFNEIQRVFCELIPEVEKISFVPVDGGKRIQVREKHIDKPILLSELSEGTRLVLTILTILHQENAPNVIGLEDIDRGLHPRLYEQVIQLCRRITEEKGVQIIATTHNPYLVDQFKGHEEAVLIVEKTNGETTFTPLSERIAKFNDVDDEDMPLGEMWYQGLVGGVPKLAY
ncbi:MAG: ATP-binding protein [Bacteroidota bacterium]